MKNVSFYHKETGLFCALSLAASVDAVVALNTPPEHVAIEGAFDHLSQRFDLETSKIVDYQPPSPSPDHEWDDEAKRWRRSLAVVAQHIDRATAQARVLHLETAVQPRLLREIALGHEDALDMLAKIDEEISSLRPLLAQRGAEIPPAAS